MHAHNDATVYSVLNVEKGKWFTNNSIMVGVLILSKETCCPLLIRAWLKASADLWCRLFSHTFDNPLLKETVIADILLAFSNSLPNTATPTPHPKTWTGAWLQTLTWLAATPCTAVEHLTSYLEQLHRAYASGAATLTQLPPSTPTLCCACLTRAALDASQIGGGR